MQKFLRTLMLLALMLPFASQAQLTLPISMDFEDAAAFNQWTLVNCNSSTTRSTTANAIHEGSAGFAFHWSTTSSNPRQHLISPEFTPAMGTEMLSFWYQNASTTYVEEFSVGFSSTTNDTAAFTWLPAVSVPFVSWTEYTASVPAGTKYVCIRSNAYDKYYLYIDDIYIGEAPTCFKVTNLAIDASQTTGSSLTLTWTDTINSGATYSIYNMADSSVVAENINGTTYTVNNLAANTAYAFGVMTDCGGGDVTGFATVSGRTACGAISLPWTCGFETSEIVNTTQATALPWCSQRYVTPGATNGTNYPYSYSGYSHSGSRSLYYYGSTSASYPDMMAWILPELDVATYPMNANRVVFWAKMSSTSYSKYVYVYTVTDPTDITTATLVDSVQVTGTTHTKYSVPLTSAPATDAYLVLAVMKGNGSLYMDDVTLEEMPSCLEVPTATVDTATASSITLSWTENSGNASATYSVYILTPTDTTLVESNITGTTYTVENLDANTPYVFAVQANCPAGDAPYTLVNGRTSCAVEALPFTENFSATLSSDPCWRGASILYTDGVNVTMGNNSNWIYSNSESNGLAAGHYRVNIYGTSCYKWLITPEIDLTEATNPLLTFDAAFTAFSGTAVASGFESNASQKFMILVSSNNGQTWSVASDIALSTIASLTYIPQYVNLAPYAGDTVRIAFYAQSTTSGGDNNLHIDNINVDESTGDICYPVSGLAASNVTATGATLTWEGSADSYNVYTIAGADTTLVDNVTSNSLEIDNLTAMTNYTYGVRSVCGSDESDMMSVTFRTACSTVAMPFTQNFNNLTAGIPMCWDNEEGTTTTADYRWNYYATGHDGAGLRFNCYYNSNGNTNVLATPAITIDEAAQLSFWYKNPTGGDFTVMVGIAGSDTRTTLATGLTGASDWTLATYVLPDSLIDENVVVYFKGTSNYGNGDAYIYLDDVTIEAVPNCLPVTGLTATDITATGATLTWTGEADSYNVYTIAGDDTTLVANVTSNSLEINTLTAMTNYTYGVRSVCGSDEGSMVVVEFTTACTAIAVPFTENFETTSPTFQCWTVDGVSSTGLSNDAFLFFYSTNPPQYLVSPELSGVTDGLTVSFRYKAYSNNFPESFQLGYSTTTNAYADFTWLAEVNNITSLTYTEYSQILPGAVKYVAVKYTANNQYGLYIDSMVFAEPPACMPVTDLTVDSVTATSVFLSWNGTAAAYNIYSATGNVVATGVTTTNYEVTGLTASTNYTFGVASVCGSDQSDVVTVPARTDCTGGSCTIKIYAEDEYGDGWADEYGAAYSNITISQNGATVATYSMQSQNLSNTTIYDTFTVNVCSGVPVTFTWNSNSEYDSEASFKILDGNDTVLISVSDASMLTDGAAFLTVNDACGSNTPIQILDSVKVTVAVNNATMGTTVPAPGVHYFYEGDVASVVAQPAAGYHLEGWTVLATIDYGSYGGITTIIDTTLNIAEPNVFTLFDFDTVQAGDHVYEFFVTANFAAGAAEPDTVTLIVNVPDPTRGTTTPAPGTHYFTTGQTLSLTAQPAAGYMLADWMYTVVNPTGDTVVDAEYADTNVTDFFDIFEDFPAVGPMLDGYIINVTPIFQGVIPTTHTVTVTSMNPQMGTVNPEGDSVVNDGSSFTATATPNEGYHFVNWVDAGSNVITDNPYTFVVNSNVTLRAVFAADSVAPTTYTVTVNVNDSTMGHVTGVPTAPVTANTVISLTAVPEAGYHFVSWSNGANTATITVTVTSDTVLTATFAANPADTYTLTVAYDATMGSVEGIPEAPVAAGTVVTLTAIPAEGYHFVEWSTGETTATISVTVNSNMTLTATFAANAVDKYLVSVLWDATMGNVTGVPTDSVPAGSPVTLMANPLEGYQFVAWMIGEDTVGHNAVYTIDSVSANVTLVALFAVKTGIEDVEMSNVKIYSAESVIYVMGAEGQNVYLYDLNGRVINAAPKAGERVEFRMNNTGVYLVKVGTAAAKRVVVTR